MFAALLFYSNVALRHMAVCRVAKKVVCNTSVLFTGAKISTSRILKTTEPISNNFIYIYIYIMPYIYLTLHNKFDADHASSSQALLS